MKNLLYICILLTGAHSFAMEEEDVLTKSLDKMVVEQRVVDENAENDPVKMVDQIFRESDYKNASACFTLLTTEYFDKATTLERKALVDQRRKFLLTSWLAYLEKAIKKVEIKRLDDAVEWANFLIEDPAEAAKVSVIKCFKALKEEHNKINADLKPLQTALGKKKADKQAILEKEEDIDTRDLDQEIEGFGETIKEKEDRALLLESKRKALRDAWIGDLRNTIDSAAECISKFELVISSDDTPITEAFRECVRRQKEGKKAFGMLAGIEERLQELAGQEAYFKMRSTSLDEIIKPIQGQLGGENILLTPRSEVQSAEGSSSSDKEKYDEVELSRSDTILAEKEKIFKAIETQLGMNLELDKRNAQEELTSENEEDEEENALQMANEQSEMLKNSFVSILKLNIVRVLFTTGHDNELTTRMRLTHLLNYLIAEKNATVEAKCALQNIKSAQQSQQETLQLYVAALKKEEEAFNIRLMEIRGEKHQHKEHKNILEQLKKRLSEEKQEIENEFDGIEADSGEGVCIIF